MSLTAQRYDGGQTIPHTPVSAVSAGDVVVVGEIVAVANHAIAASAAGALSIEGTYSMPKATTSSSAITAGAKLYWDASGEVVTTTAGSNKIAGYATEAADDDDSSINVKLARA